MIVKYKEFISPTAAADFAKTIMKDKLISISHSNHVDNCHLTCYSIYVWYWE